MKLITVFSVIIIWINKSSDAERWHNRQRISYYADVSQSVNRTQAEVACTARVGRLALLKDEETHRFVCEILPRKNAANSQYFIGLQAGSQDCGCGSGISAVGCTACRQLWRWDDGTVMTADRWQQDMPVVRENRKCGTENSYQQYSAVDCGSSRGFICQYNCKVIGCHDTECSFTSSNIYICQCASGYTGQHCDEDINECASHPCMNEATCNNLLNAFSCNCTPGYTGVRCETDINECMSEPCKNNGTCRDRINYYECFCPDGYIGTNCETEIDECDSDPCQHGGNCTDLVNMYNCSCREQYYGNNCENEFNITGTTTPRCSETDCTDNRGLWIALAVCVVITIIIWSSFGIMVLRHYRTATKKPDEIMMSNIQEGDK